MVEIEGLLALIRGSIPARDRRTVEGWAADNQDALRVAWNHLNPDKAI